MEAGGQKIWFIPTMYRGQSCYRVFWGRYPTREAAALAAGSIPQALRGAAPAVVRIP
jgi:septal ring-binding cell division protein DamX